MLSLFLFVPMLLGALLREMLVVMSLVMAYVTGTVWLMAHDELSRNMDSMLLLGSALLTAALLVSVIGHFAGRVAVAFYRQIRPPIT